MRPWRDATEYRRAGETVGGGVIASMRPWRDATEYSGWRPA